MNLTVFCKIYLFCSYWTFNASNQNCVGHSTTQTCIITMGFCRALQLNTGCQQSSLCVKTVTGTEKNETMYNAGEFQRNTNPYHTIPSSPSKYFHCINNIRKVIF